jgi:cytochrome c-type biogenesis protein CcmF
MRPSGESAALLTREVVLGAGTLSLVLIAVVVLFGTSLPIFSTLRVEPAFYDSTTLPIAIALGLLIGLSLYAGWEEQDLAGLLRRSWKSALAALLAAGGCVLLGVHDPLLALLAFASAFTLFVNLDIAVTVARGNWRFLGGKFAHVGVALFFFGVIGSGRYSTHASARLPLNQAVDVLGSSMTYTGVRPIPGGKFAFDIRVQEAGGSYTLSPVMFETRDQGIMKNPDIASFAVKDLYIAPVALEAGEAQTVGDPVIVPLTKGETQNVGNVRVTFTRFDMSSHEMPAGAEGMPVGAVLTIASGADTESVMPVTLFSAQGAKQYRPADSRLLGAIVRLADMNVGMGGGGTSAVTISIEKMDARGVTPETLVVEASVKPVIILVWLGTLVMMAGFALSIVHRSKEA